MPEINWNEKYRCKTLTDIKGQNYNVKKLIALVDNIRSMRRGGDCPHMYFQGPPGTGKTNCVTAFLQDAFGDDWELNYYEYNASETRIDKIRSDVMELASDEPLGSFVGNDGDVTKVGNNVSTYTDWYACSFSNSTGIQVLNGNIANRKITPIPKNIKGSHISTFAARLVPELDSRLPPMRINGKPKLKKVM